MNATDIVGYAYEADLHCVDCAGASGLDLQGDEVSPVFFGEDAFEECRDCAGSGHSGRREHCLVCRGSGSISRCCGDCGEPLVD